MNDRLPCGSFTVLTVSPGSLAGASGKKGGKKYILIIKPFIMSNLKSSRRFPRRKIITEIIASLLLIFYVHTFISTYVNLQSLKNMLPFYTSNNNMVAWTIVVIEIVIVVLLFLPKTRLIGFVGALITTFLAGYLVIKYPDNPHHFGGLLNHISDTQQITLYSLLSLLEIAGVGLLAIRPKRHSSNIKDSIVFT